MATRIEFKKEAYMGFSKKDEPALCITTNEPKLITAIKDMLDHMIYQETDEHKYVEAKQHIESYLQLQEEWEKLEAEQEYGEDGEADE